MRDLVDNWLDGLGGLIGDDLISFYTYFTIVFAEIAFLWGCFPNLSIPFTIILLASILNIIFCSFIKACLEYTRLEWFASLMYIIIFVALFVIGSVFNILASVVLFAIPITITALWIKIRHFQDSVFCYEVPKIIERISTLFMKKWFWMLSQVIVIGLPLVLLCIGLLTTSLPIYISCIIVVSYALLAPYISYLEDSLSASDIIELALDIRIRH